MLTITAIAALYCVVSRKSHNPPYAQKLIGELGAALQLEPIKNIAPPYFVALYGRYAAQACMDAIMEGIEPEDVLLPRTISYKQIISITVFTALIDTMIIYHSQEDTFQYFKSVLHSSTCKIFSIERWLHWDDIIHCMSLLNVTELKNLIFDPNPNLIHQLVKTQAPFDELLTQNIPILTYMVKRAGSEVIEPLNKITNTLFASLNDTDICSIVQKLGVTSITPLASADVPFYTLQGQSISTIIQHLGINAINPLQEAGANFSNLSDLQIAKILQILGREGIAPLKEAGTIFEYLKTETLTYIVQILGVDSIKLLQAADAPFSKLENARIVSIIQKLTPESISLLKGASVNFASFKSKEIFDILDIWGSSAIKPLYDASVNFKELQAQHISQIIEEAGTEIILLLDEVGATIPDTIHHYTFE